jgi:hypothetical protein
MGNFYVNYTLRGVGQSDVAKVLVGRRARVTPVHKDCVVVFDEASESQDRQEITQLAAKLSKKLSCPVLIVLNHDDDILWYRLYVKGNLSDEYDSNPDCFESVPKPSGPVGGDAAKLCATFGGDQAAVEKVLRVSKLGVYAFEFERHAALVEALGISDYAVGTSYLSFRYNELPEGFPPTKSLQSISCLRLPSRTASTFS